MYDKKWEILPMGEPTNYTYGLAMPAPECRKSRQISKEIQHAE